MTQSSSSGPPASRLERVVGAVLRQQNRVLLCLRSRHRIHYPGVWDLPGGHLQDDETPSQALARELDEELDIRLPMLPSLPWTTQYFEGGELSIFLIDAWQGVPRNRATDEHEEIRWFALEELRVLALAHPGYIELLERAVSS